MDYQLEKGAILRLYCCRAPYKGLQRKGTYLARKPAQAGMFGSTTATAYTQFCRTDWLMIPGRAAVLIEGEGMSLARFVTLLSQFQRLPDRQRGNAFQLAAQASGLPIIRLGKKPTFLESYDLAARPGQGGPGTVYLSLNQQKPTSPAQGAKILNRRVLSVPDLGDLEIYEARRNGQPFCFSKPLKLSGTTPGPSTMRNLPLAIALSLSLGQGAAAQDYTGICPSRRLHHKDQTPRVYLPTPSVLARASQHPPHPTLPRLTAVRLQVGIKVPHECSKIIELAKVAKDQLSIDSEIGVNKHISKVGHRCYLGGKILGKHSLTTQEQNRVSPVLGSLPLVERGPMSITH